jgi:hypothetical protein
MGDRTSSYATAGIALRVSGALKPHHHDKVETPSVGLSSVFFPIHYSHKHFTICRYIIYSIQLWLDRHLLGLGRFFSSLMFYVVGRTPWTGDQPVARPLPAHRATPKQDKRTQTSMPRVEFESTTPVFQRAKTVHVFDRAVIVIGDIIYAVVQRPLNTSKVNHKLLYRKIYVLILRKQSVARKYSKYDI